MSEFPYLMAKDALKLKETALQLRVDRSMAHISVSADALLSLIEQAHSPNLGIATTRMIREELDSRGPDSPDDYRTFNPAEETS